MDEESEVSNRTQEKLVYHQKSPKELAVYDLIKNIARRELDNSYKDLAFKWSNYKIVFEQVGAFDKTDGETTIKMLDGRIVEELTGSSITKDLKEQKKEAEEIVKAAAIPSIGKSRRKKSTNNKQSRDKKKSKKASLRRKGARK